MRPYGLEGLLILLLVVLAFPILAVAQGDSKKPVIYQSIGDYEVPAGKINFYGHTLNPYHDYYEKPGERGYIFIEKYNAYRWDDMRYLVPELFPNAQKDKMSAEQLCDMMIPIDLGYLNKMEELSYGMAEYLIPHFPDLEYDLQYLDELDQRLRSKNPQAIKDLISYMPEDDDNKAAKVMAAKEFQLKSWTVSILRDAAIHNCPEHAKKMGYVPYVGPYPELPPQ